MKTMQGDRKKLGMRDGPSGYRGENKSWPSSLVGETGINQIITDIVTNLGRGGPWSHEVGHVA